MSSCPPLLVSCAQIAEQPDVLAHRSVVPAKDVYRLLRAVIVRVADVIGISGEQGRASGADARVHGVEGDAAEGAPLIVDDGKVGVGGITGAGFHVHVSALPEALTRCHRTGLSCFRRRALCPSLSGKSRDDEQRPHYGTTRVSPLSMRGISFGPIRVVSPRSASCNRTETAYNRSPDLRMTRAPPGFANSAGPPAIARASSALT